MWNLLNRKVDIATSAIVLIGFAFAGLMLGHFHG